MTVIRDELRIRNLGQAVRRLDLEREFWLLGPNGMWGWWPKSLVGERWDRIAYAEVKGR